MLTHKLKVDTAPKQRGAKNLALLLAISLVSITSHAGSLYVSADGGRDTNPGTQSAPLLTIARADALSRAGDTIYVAPGTYKVSAPAINSYGMTTTHNGTSAARIRFISTVKHGAKIVVSGYGIAWHSKGSYVDIDGFDISGTGRLGIFAYGNNISITNNLIHDLTISGGCNGNGGAAIDTYGPGGGLRLISGNIVRNIGYSLIGKCNTVQGIYIANADNLVTNNLVSGVGAVGIHQWHGATASTIMNNTVLHCKEGILIGNGDAGALPGGSDNNYVANNIVYDHSTYGIIEFGKVGTKNSYVNNLVISSGTNWRVAGAVSGSISANPLFVNYKADGSGDYHLQKNSPAIDRGSSVYAPSTDIDGNARIAGAIDLGAYQYTISSPVPAPIPTPAPPVPAPVPVATLTLSATKVLPGSKITVKVSGASSTALDWVALYVASNPDSTYSYRGNWMELNGTQVHPKTPITSATLVFTMPKKPGVYNIRLFEGDGYSKRAAISQNITVLSSH